jgi:hypothetical protein
MLRSYKRLVMFYCTVLFCIPCSVIAQSAPDLKLQERKRFISKVELFGGPSLWMPDDHGLAKFLLKSSDGSIIYKAKSEAGYQFGLSLIQSIGKRFEIQGKISKVRVHYSEHETNLDLNGNVFSESILDQRNDQVVLSLIPTYFISNSDRLHIFGGVSYSFLTRSLEYGSYSAGGQSTPQPSINTIDGFEKHVLNALLGIGYCHPVSKRIEANLRIQGEYGLSYTLSQNQANISINGISLSIALRYSR